jgi:hypothetical protein
MGAEVAELSYGVILKEADYKKLHDLLFEEKELPNVSGKWLVEKDKKSLLTIDNPYETEDARDGYESDLKYQYSP